MTKYREILRLTALRLSQRNVMQSINVSQKTVVKVQRRAREMNQIHRIKELNLKSCENAKNSLEKVIQFIYPFYRTTLEARRENNVKAKN